MLYHPNKNIFSISAPPAHFLKNNKYPIPQPPHNKTPAGAMPEPRKQKDNKKINIGSARIYSDSAERNVQLLLEPGR